MASDLAAEQAEAVEGEVVESSLATCSTSLVRIHDAHEVEFIAIGREIISEYTGEDGKRYMEETQWIKKGSGEGGMISAKWKEGIREALYREKGVLEGVLERLNWDVIAKSELIKWIKAHDLSNDLLLAREGLIDESERVVRDKVESGDIEAAKFVLKTIGKRRGWSERDVEDVERRSMYGYINVSEVGGKEIRAMSNEELTKVLEERMGQF